MIDAISFMENLEQEGTDFKKDLSYLKTEEQIEILKLSCKEFYPEEEIRKKFIDAKANNEFFSVKYGIDPSSIDMQIGDIPPLVLSGKLQRMGHKVTILIGDFTAMIGDPFIVWNAKELSRKSIERNLKHLKKQLDNFLDFAKVNTVYNSSWLNDMRLPKLIELMKKVNVMNILMKDKFKEKLDKGENFTFAKLIYPFITGIDSIEINPDIEIGKDNQISNFHMCRHMMDVEGLIPEVVMTTIPMPEESLFSIDTKPIDIFKKVSKLDKESVYIWFRLLTEISPNRMRDIEKLAEKGELDLQAIKEILAKIIVTRIYDKDESDLAYIEYVKELVKKSETQDIAVLSGSVEIGEFIAASTDLTLAEAKSYIKSGGTKMLSCDGKSLVHIIECGADINSISFDKFYIIISDRLILSIKK